MSIVSTTASTASARWQEFILGGQKSGKSKRAELLAQQWLQAQPGRRAVYLATGQAFDAEMQQRIARHQQDRAARVPGLETKEVPHHLAQALRTHGDANTLLIVDCLTMWLTNWSMPLEPLEAQDLAAWETERQAFLQAVYAYPGAVVIVGNEIGWGVIPMGAQVRQFVDALGALNQAVAAVCSRVTLMAAGLPMSLK